MGDLQHFEAVAMKQNELLSQWLAEEEAAQIHGWDFSHIHGRYEEGRDLPWDFDQLVRRFLFPEHRILDMERPYQGNKDN
mgnify:CR=1 FL=1